MLERQYKMYLLKSCLLFQAYKLNYENSITDETFSDSSKSVGKQIPELALKSDINALMKFR